MENRWQRRIHADRHAASEPNWVELCETNPGSAEPVRADGAWRVQTDGQKSTAMTVLEQARIATPHPAEDLISTATPQRVQHKATAHDQRTST